MDKTNAISIGGISFLIEEIAYKNLSNYLDAIRISLQKTEGIDEIISDVERRISEIFKEKLNLTKREVINPQDVTSMIEIMGTPDQYIEEDIHEKSRDEKTDNTNMHRNRKLYRDEDDKIIGGVCSGLSYYLGIDPVWIRLVFILLMFIWGTPILLYFVLWLIVPEAKTTTEKLQMRGQNVDYESIKEYLNIDGKKMNADVRKFGNEVNGIFNNLTPIIRNILILFFKAIKYFVAGVLILIGVSLLCALIPLILQKNIMGTNLLEFNSFLGFETWKLLLGTILVGIIILIPSVLMIYSGIRIISQRFKMHKYALVSMVGIWLVSGFGLLILGAMIGQEFSNTADFVKKENLVLPSDTVVLSLKSVENKITVKKTFFGDDINLHEGKISYKINPTIFVRVSPTKESFIEIKYKSEGKSTNEAGKNIQNILYHYSIDKNNLVLDDYLTLLQNSKLRGQDITLVIWLPEGKIIKNNNLEKITFVDDSNNWNNFDNIEHKIFTFATGKPKCLNCPLQNDKTENIDIKINNNHIKIHNNGTDTTGIGNDNH